MRFVHIDCLPAPPTFDNRGPENERKSRATAICETTNVVFVNVIDDELAIVFASAGIFPFETAKSNSNVTTAGSHGVGHVPREFH